MRSAVPVTADDRGARGTRGGSILAVVALVLVGACGDDGAVTGAAPDPPDAPTTPDPADTGDGTAGPCDPARPAPAGTDERSLTVDGEARRALVHVPAAYDGATPVPLLLDLHGFGGSPETQVAATDLPTVAGDRGYVVVTPAGGPLRVPDDAPAEATGFEGVTFWNVFRAGGLELPPDGPIAASDPDELGADDVAFVAALLDALDADLCVDRSRVFATGMSNGAGMAVVVACELGDRIRAIVPVAGANLTGGCAGRSPVSARVVHADDDDVVPVAGGTLLGFEIGNPSLDDRLAELAARGGCAPEPEADAPSPGVRVSRWPDCDEGVRVERWLLDGVGHTWPRHDPVDVSEVVVDFLDGFPARTGR